MLYITILVEPGEVWTKRTFDAFLIGDKRYPYKEIHRKWAQGEIESLEAIEREQVEVKGYASIREHWKIDIFATQLQSYPDTEVVVVEDYLHNAPKTGYVLFQAGVQGFDLEQFRSAIAKCSPDQQKSLIKRLVLLNASERILEEYPVAATVSENHYYFRGATTPGTGEIWGYFGILNGHTSVAKVMNAAVADYEEEFALISSYSGERLASFLIRYLQAYTKLYGLNA